MRLLRYSILPLLILGLWWLVTRGGAIPAILLPPPADVGRAALELFSSGEGFRHAGTSLLRVFAGYGISSLAALTLAAVLARSPKLEAGAHVVLESLRVVPPLSLIPLLILWLGIDNLIVLKALNVGPDALYSTLGRTAARGIETLAIAKQIDAWLKSYQDNIVKDQQIVEDLQIPQEARGVGFVNAPRGGLSHWLRIEGGKIGNFQLVVPTTWNLGPRDAKDALGPAEQALIGTPVADPKRPVEILRTIHSFDPCIACAVHVIDGESNEVHKFKVL